MLQILRDAHELGQAVAQLVAEQLRQRPHSVLALPTGATPLSLYRSLVYLHRLGDLDFTAVTAFNLDEIYGLSPEHHGSFAAYLHRELFDRVNIRPGNINLLNGLARDVGGECRAYERKIRAAGGLDLAILGIGPNGHIAFNEPGSPFSSRTRLVRLAPETQRHLRESFSASLNMGGSEPFLALTMGVATIMEARRILLLASGSAKAEIVARALRGPVTPDVPASILQRHSNLSIIIDQEAAAVLSRAGVAL